MITETFLHDFQVLDVVALRIAMPDEGLKAGMIGTIVEIWDEEKQVFEVEFCDQQGQTIANCAIKAVSLINISMEKEVAKLSLFHQIAFAYRIVERLLPNYVQFVENEHFGDIETLQKGLDLLKEIVLTETVNEETKEKIATLLPEIDAVIPDTEDYGSLQAGLALDACGAVYDALLGILENDKQKISAVAFLPFNSAEMIIYSQELENEDLMLAEKTFQEHLLDYLQTHSTTEVIFNINATTAINLVFETLTNYFSESLIFFKSNDFGNVILIKNHFNDFSIGEIEILFDQNASINRFEATLYRFDDQTQKVKFFSAENESELVEQIADKLEILGVLTKEDFEKIDTIYQNSDLEKELIKPLVLNILRPRLAEFPKFNTVDDDQLVETLKDVFSYRDAA